MTKLADDINNSIDNIKETIEKLSPRFKNAVQKSIKWIQDNPKTTTGAGFIMLVLMSNLPATTAAVAFVALYSVYQLGLQKGKQAKQKPNTLTKEEVQLRILRLRKALPKKVTQEQLYLIATEQFEGLATLDGDSILKEMHELDDILELDALPELSKLEDQEPRNTLH